MAHYLHGNASAQLTGLTDREFATFMTASDEHVAVIASREERQQALPCLGARKTTPLINAVVALNGARDVVTMEPPKAKPTKRRRRHDDDDEEEAPLRVRSLDALWGGF
jgi:hypothetical protein